ncbi:MAG: T9SS type A sorting domain-containing protein, partial [Candidatus Zixiibacteriota bacterium]
LAKDIADQINNNTTVAAGVIDLNIPNISYKGSVAADIRVPVSYELSQNYPNPFNASTVIEYQLPQATAVRLEVYNLLGEKVAALVNDVEEAGYKSVTWDASEVSSGLYFYKLTAGDFTQTRRMMLVK